MKKKIIFRADGNSSTGLGHLFRLFALVEIYKDKFEYEILTQGSSTLEVIPNSYNVSTIPEIIDIDKEPNWLSENYPPSKFLIIADGYQFVTSYQKKIKDKGYKLIYIDDLANVHMHADLVINHSPYIKEKHYSKNSYTKLALGTKYAMLRPLFLKEAKKNRIVTFVDRAFVCFGGSDSFDLTLKAVKALLQMSNFKKIEVVLGGAYKHKKIYEIEEKYSDSVTIHRNLSEEALLKVMQKCNFAIAPSSTILYELCCVKIPVLSGFYIDNQKLIYKGFLNSEAIYKGADMKNYVVSDFVRQIEIILTKGEFNDKIKAQSCFFDDKIASRHLKLIEGVC